MSVQCSHWHACHKPNAGRCDLGFYRGYPTEILCRRVCQRSDGLAPGQPDPTPAPPPPIAAAPTRIDAKRKTKRLAPVGTVLKALLARLGHAEESCRCNSRARTLDRAGAVWSWQHRGEIVGWLQEAAAARRFPFRPRAAELLVVAAIVLAVLPRALRPVARD
jgi:hypothetical protein